MSTQPTKGVNLKAVFIGDKAENGQLYKDLLTNLIDQHLGWRQNYMPQDEPGITFADQEEDSYKQTVRKQKEVLSVLSRRMRTDSVPWHSAGRYWGHMCSETLMPALLAYNFATLWNSNNVAFEASPATSLLEEEVGMDLSHLLGFGDKGWGHLTAGGGTTANLEGLWYMRNLKSLPLAIKEVQPELVEGKSEWDLLNMSVKDALNLWRQAKEENIEKIKFRTARCGNHISKLGKLIVPMTKHYSWPKAADVLGIGTDNVVPVPISSHYTLDVEKLESIIRKTVAEGTPILAVVGVVGTTEEGQVDPIDKMVALRKKLHEELGIWFYIYVDAAYAGYARTLFVDEDGEFIDDYDKLVKVHEEYGVFSDGKAHISRDVYNAFKAFKDVDAVTIDPHKMGYIPYAAGAIVVSDRYMREVISYFATYVFEKGAECPALLGAYMLDGSKAGATAASVWTAHRVLPLNVSGYGKLLGASIEGAQNFYHFLQGLTFDVEGKVFEVVPLVEPDFNMVDFVIREKGNNSLVEMNAFNNEFYKESSFNSGMTYYNGFILSHTDFSIPDYGDGPIKFVCEDLGFSLEEWKKAGKITILRACVLSPYMNDKKLFDSYAKSVREVIEQRLKKLCLKK